MKCVIILFATSIHIYTCKQFFLIRHVSTVLLCVSKSV